MAANINRLVSTLLLITVTYSAQTFGCPVQCRSCDNGRVLCSQASLTRIPQSLPEESLSIDFSQNEITSLDGLPPLPETMSMTFMGNKISTVEGRSFIKVPQLMRLDLSMNNIRKVYKQGFKGLDNIMTISLNGNSLKSIGKIFANTPALTSLRMSFNQIEEIGDDHFDNNQNLKMLDLSNNLISKIHPKAFEKLTMLRILILSNNPLGTLPEMALTNSMLTLADFTNCQLTAVPRRMPETLNDFRLGNNMITKILADDFENVTGLTLLTLNDNQIADVEHRSFYYLENLMELWMSRNKMVYIPRGLPMHLEKFHIDNNNVVAFEPKLFKEGSLLKVMSLEANDVRNIHRDALQELNHVESLNFQGNQITEIQTGTFTNLDHLKTLTLANNPIQEIQAGAFGNLGNLTELSLSYIEGDQNPNKQIITENFLKNMPNLETLDIMSSFELAKKFINILETQPATLGNVKTVKLEYNDLEGIPEAMKQAFENAENVYLDGNILVCDKNLIWLNKWMKSSNKKFYEFDPPTCHGSGNLDGRPIADLSEGEFIEVVQEENQANQQVPKALQPINNQPDQAPIAEAKSESRSPVDANAREPEEPNPPQVKQSPGSLSGNRQRGASKYDKGVGKYDSQPARPNPLPPQANQNPVQQPANRGSFFATRVVIKPPKKNRNKQQASVKKKPWSKLTKEEKAARKAARKAERLRQRALKRRQRQKRHHDDPAKGRKKRRIRKNCKTDETGAVKCERGRRKRCKVLDDGTVKCRKRKGGKKRKNGKSKKDRKKKVNDVQN